MKVGDQVTYKELSLQCYRGEITQINDGSSYCTIRWTSPVNVAAKEYTSNLMKVKEA